MDSARTEEFVPALTASWANTNVSLRFSLNCITAHDIKCVIDYHSQTTSIGSDGISIAILKKSPLSLLSALTIILNKSVMSGVFPSRWKNAIVVPFFQERQCLRPHNYRPIALLSVKQGF